MVLMVQRRRSSFIGVVVSVLNQIVVLEKEMEMKEARKVLGNGSFLFVLVRGVGLDDGLS
jgi:hypothetical protein